MPDFDAQVRTKSGGEVWLTFIILPLALPDNPLTVHVFHPVRHRDYSEAHTPAGTSTTFSVVWSPRERAILGCLIGGATTGEIAAELTISPLTVRTHIRNMLAKAGLRSRVQLVSLGVRGGGR